MEKDVRPMVPIITGMGIVRPMDRIPLVPIIDIIANHKEALELIPLRVQEDRIVRVSAAKKEGREIIMQTETEGVMKTIVLIHRVLVLVITILMQNIALKNVWSIKKSTWTPMLRFV